MTTATIQIDANASKAVQEFERLKARASGTLSGISSEAQALSGTLGVLAGSAAAVSFVGMVKGALDAGDSISKLSQRTGMTTESLSAWQYAADMAGVSNDTLSKGIKALGISMSQSLAGDKEKVAMFKALGVSVTDAAGKLKATEQVLLEVADAYQGAHDGAGKVAVGQALMGKASEEMIPLLNGGSEAIKAMKAEAQALGLVISSDFAAQAEAFNDNLARLGTGGRKLGLDLASELLPAMQAVVQELVNTKTASGEVGESLGTKLGGGLRIVTEAVAILAANVNFTLHALGTEIGGIAAQLAALARLDFDGFSAIGDAMKADAVKARAEFDALERRLLGIKEKGQAAFEDGFAGSTVLTDTAKRTLQLASATSAAETEYEKLIKRINERVAASSEELRLGRALTDQEKFEVKLHADMTEAKKKLTAAEREALEVALKTSAAKDLELRVQQSELADAQARASERQRIRNAEYEAARQAGIALTEADSARLKTARETLEQIEFETRLLSLNTAEREQAIVTRELEKQGIKEGTEAWQQYADKIKAAAGARAAAQEQIDNFRGVWESIDRTAHETFTNIFEGGSNAFKKLGQTLKASLLDLLYQLTVKKWVINLAANMTGASGSVVQAVTGNSGNGLLGSIGNGVSLYNGASNVGTIGSQWAAGSMSTANAGGTLYANATSSGLDGLLATNGAYGTAANGGSAASGAMGGMGAFAILLAPIMAALADGYFSGETRTGGNYGYSFNGTSARNTRRGTTVAADGVGAVFLEGPDGGAADDALTKGVINGIVSGINDTLKVVGSTLSLTGFQAGWETGKRGGIFAGGTLSDGRTFGMSGTGDNYEGELYKAFGTGRESPAEVFKAFTADMKRTALEALQVASGAVAQLRKVGEQVITVNGVEGSGENAVPTSTQVTVDVARRVFDDVALAAADAAGVLPKRIWELIRGVDFESKTAEEVDAVLAKISTMVASVKGFGEIVDQFPTEAFKSIGFDVAASLVELAGGIQAFGEGYAAYAENFYSDTEKRARTVDAISTSLESVGLSLDGIDLSSEDARLQFRAMAEGIDQNTEAGAKQLAMLLSVAAAFASVTPPLREVVDTVDEVVDEVGAGLDELRSQARDLVQQYKDAAASTESARAALRDFGDQLQATADGIAEQINTLRGRAAEALASAMENAQDALAAVQQANDQAQQRVTDAQRALGTALQGVSQAIEQAAARVQAAAEGVRTAYAALEARNTQAQQAVTAAQDTLQAALRGVAGAVAQAAQRVATTSASVQSALTNMQTRSDQAQQAVQSAQTALDGALEGVARAVAQAAQNVAGAQDAVQSARAGITQGYLSALEREAAVKARITQAYLQAQEQVTAAQDRLSQAQAGAARAMNQAGDSILATLRQLAGTNAGTGDVRQQYRFSRGTLDSLVARALAGDAEAAGQVSAAGQGFLQASRKVSSAQQLTEDDIYMRQQLARVLAVAGSTGTAASSDQDGVAQAQAALQLALERAAAAQALATQSGASLVASNEDLAAEMATAATEVAKWSAAVTASGASTAAEQADLLATYTAAMEALSAAQQAHADVLNATQGLDLDGIQLETNEWAAAVAAAHTAQDDLTEAQEAATAASADLQVALGLAAAAGVAMAGLRTPLADLQAALDALTTAQQSQAELMAVVSGAAFADVAAGADNWAAMLAAASQGVQLETNDWAAAVAAAQTAQENLTHAQEVAAGTAADLEAAMQLVAAAGVAIGQVETPLGALQTALDALADAQDSQAALWEATGTLDLDGIQASTYAWEDAVNAAKTAQDNLTAAHAAADLAAGDLASALLDAAAAGVSFAQVQIPLQLFQAALEELTAAQDTAAAVQADLYVAGDDLVTQYGALQAAAGTAADELADFQARVAGIDLTTFTSKLDTLLDGYTQATGNQSAVYQQIAATTFGQQINSAYSSVFGRQAEEAGMVYWFDKLANGATTRDMLGGLSSSAEFQQRYAGGGDVGAIRDLVAAFDWSNASWRAIYDKARANGINSRQVDDALQVGWGTSLNWALQNGLPAFERGGVHTGGWALVGEKGPELAYMPPARIYNAAQTAAMTNDAGSQAQASTLRELKSAIEAVAINTARMEKTLARALHRKGDAFATREMTA